MKITGDDDVRDITELLFPLFCPFLFPHPDSICLGEGATTFKFEPADAIKNP
jgi:hypothetical protein